MQGTESQSRPIPVLIVDDHPLLREGPAAIIPTERDLLAIAETGNDREGIERFRVNRPDVRLLDLQMPEMGGVTATGTAAIREEWSGARVTRRHFERTP